MKLETNIENIAEIAERKRNENISFSSYLKGQDIGKN